jgi:hypothetical protein
VPDGNLKIRYVHGYRSFDCTNNVKFLKNNNIVYHSAALGIVLNPDTNEQTFFNQHQEDIVSLAMHPNVFIERNSFFLIGANLCYRSNGTERES